MEFLTEYGLFLAKVTTVVFAIAMIVSIVVGASQKNKQSGEKGHLEITPLNQQFDDMSEAMLIATMDESLQKAEEKKLHKAKKKQAKLDRKLGKKLSKDLDKNQSKNSAADSSGDVETKSRVFVLNFNGNISASATSHLREEITAVLTQATAHDEVLVKLESPGGMVHSYGLASSQLDRIRKAQIPLTVCVDKVAASGGYMMACIADRIIAAPFAVLGSIGVVAQVPNFNRLLKSQKVDVELHTAGAHKRTLTMFGENTDEGRLKFKAELEEVHQLFKVFVSDNRPQVEIEVVATGEAWYGQRALEQQLIDEIQTSDEYLIDKMPTAAVYEIVYEIQQSKVEKLVKRFAQLTSLIPTQSRVLARHNLD